MTSDPTIPPPSANARAKANPNLETGEVSLFDADYARCPQPVYSRLLAHCPVAKTALLGTPVISRYEDVRWALRHPEIFSSEMELQMALGTQRPMIPQQIDPPAQTRYRKLLDPFFSRRRMAELEPAVRAQANALIDRFVDRGECEFDTEFAVPLPCSVFLSLLGLPLEDLELFLDLKDGIIRPTRRPGVSFEDAPRVRSESGQRIYAYFEAVLDEREARPRDDLLSRLLASEIDGERLSRTELLDICFLLLLAGLDTVTATLGCSIAYLAANPEQRRRVCADATCLDGAVEELLRWETPVTGVPRVLKQDVEIGGVTLEAGSMVTLLLGAADVDGGEFPEPARVDFARQRNRHLAFGAGPHRCLGSHLARLELRLALEEWHRRIPEYGVRPGDAPRYSAGIREVMHLPLVWPVASA